jgi:hypothetical protein
MFGRNIVVSIQWFASDPSILVIVAPTKSAIEDARGGICPQMNTDRRRCD